MMDKQMIEEMARTLGGCHSMPNCKVCCEYIGSTNCFDKIRAKKLYNAGYRKIPENAVVLNVSEYVRLKSIEENIDRVIKQKGKGTVEKFAERVKMVFYYEFDELIPSIMADKIDEIAKEITEG